MSSPLLDLLHERVESGLQKARASALLHFLGAWLKVIDDHPEWKKEQGVQGYQEVAEAGIAFAVCGGNEIEVAFQEGLQWLQGRKFFTPGRPPTLEGDSLALLALSIGVDAQKNSESKAWMMEVLIQARDSGQDGRNKDLLHLGIALIEDTDSAWETVTPLLRAAAKHRGKGKLPQDIWQAAFSEVVTPVSIPMEWSVFHAAAMKIIFAAKPNVDLARPTVEQIVELLRLVPASLKRWSWEDKSKTTSRNVTAQRWDIQHEYHVQNLLWAILRPVFPDLEDEENLPSLGHKHPRVDLTVPSLRLAIEVKYLRHSNQAARAGIVEEVSADTGLYLTADSPYDQIVVFIWDATASNHHHDEIVSGIRKLNGIVDVVIVSRPGEWK